MKLFNAQFSAKRLSGGYSLIETVIYIALFILLSAVLVATLYGMTDAYHEVRVNDDLLDSAHVSMERMTREVRNAVSIDTGASTFTTHPGVLTLNSLDATGLPKTVAFGVSALQSLEMLDSTDGTARDLTGSQVKVTSLVFRNVATATGSAVKMDVTFQSVRGSSTATLDQSSTVVLRGSY